MKPFNLEAVLSYRKRLEEIAQQRFAKAQNILRTIEKKLAEEEEKRQQLLDAIEQKQKDGVIITELILYEQRISYVIANIGAIKKNLAEKASQLEKEHQNLVKRSKDRQIMEKLKEQQNRNWRDYLDKKEAAILDEIAIVRHQSRQS